MFEIPISSANELVIKRANLDITYTLVAPKLNLAAFDLWRLIKEGSTQGHLILSKSISLCIIELHHIRTLTSRPIYKWALHHLGQKGSIVHTTLLPICKKLFVFSNHYKSQTIYITMYFQAKFYKKSPFKKNCEVDTKKIQIPFPKKIKNKIVDELANMQ